VIIEHHWEHKFLAAHETRQQAPKRSSFFLFFLLSLEESRGDVWVFWILKVPNVFPLSSHQVLIPESKIVSTHNKRAAYVSSKLP